jgi:DNA-binding response OmpR family regulator
MSEATIVLVAERDDTLRAFLVEQLSADQYDARAVCAAEEARIRLAHLQPDLLLLGEFEQPADQLRLLRALRRELNQGVRVVVLSSPGSELDELRAFEAGCDDYLCTPISYPLLRARVEAMLRRKRSGAPRSRIGSLEIDAPARTATMAGRALELSRLEFELLRHLAEDPTRVYTKPELLREVWGYKALGCTRTLDAHACRLRRKLADAGAPRLVVNVRGVGYRLTLGTVMAEPRPLVLAAAGNGRAA